MNAGLKKICIVCWGLLALACGRQAETPTARQVVDRAIEASGGAAYQTSRIKFTFRDRQYESFWERGQHVLKRITVTDTNRIEDVLKGSSFRREIDGQEVSLADTTRQKLSDAVNSVHYFAYLPYGLNDRAVRKTYLGRQPLKQTEYHKIEITFDQEGGGTDYQDVFVYWFHPETYLPDYLAYSYQTNGGGMRFREAYNERRIGGIRFVDYRNYAYSGPLPVTALDSLYEAGELELLSLIELEEIEVTPDSYN